MNFIFNESYIYSLIDKVEQNTIHPDEHYYLQKIISAQIVILQHGEDNIFLSDYVQKFMNEVDRYYNWLSENWQKINTSKREKTELFLLKSTLEKNIPTILKSRVIYKKALSHFEILAELAKIWKRPLFKRRDSIVSFLSFFMEQVYSIPPEFINNIFELMNSHWKPILAPLGTFPNKRYSFKEIEEYFFGENSKPDYSIHVIKNIDRLFSITGMNHKSHIFIPKDEDIDLFDAALIIHEFQHIVDPTDNLFLSEKNAMNAERVFLLGAKAAKRGRYWWLESNLFYPILLLSCELENLVSDERNVRIFQEVCLQYGMEPISISSLFQWGAPFQMSIYCAAAMDMEQSWQQFLQ